EAARQGQRDQEAHPQRGLLLGPALLLHRHPRGSLHARHRRLAHRGVDGQPPRAVRGQPAHPPARRLQGAEAEGLRPPGEALAVSLSLTRKLIDAHLVSGKPVAGEEIALRVDQCLLTDTNGNMAWLQFETMGFPRVRPSRVVTYIDHNVYQTDSRNTDDHRYLQTAAARYGSWFSKPGNGICHQVHFESFSVPGQLVLGTDSHTPLCGSTGMLAIGSGGLDVAVAMGGGAYHLPMPRVVRVTLTGELKPWVHAKDVILELLRRYSVRGGSGKIFEVAGTAIDQVMVGSCTNSSWEDMWAVGQTLKGRKVAPSIHFVAFPGSGRILEIMSREGLLTDLLVAGATVSEPTCGSCAGIGHV